MDADVKVPFSAVRDGTRTWEEYQRTNVEPHRERLIDKVSQTTRGRRDNYGRPLVNFLRIAILWSVYLEDRTITPENVAMMMNLLKVARIMHNLSDDSLLDIMGYADCCDDMNQHLKELGYEGGLSDCRKMTFEDLISLRGRVSGG